MKRYFLILIAILSLSACMRTVDNYNSEPMLVSTLKNLEASHKKVRVENFQTALGAGVGVHCRGYSAINASLERNDDDESFVAGSIVGGLVHYIQEAFITELERAGMFSLDAPVSLKGNVTQLSLETLHKGRWRIKLTMMSSNGRSVSVQEVLEFNTSVVGVDPCQSAADNYSHAVKHLIYQLITHPNFKYLLEPSQYTEDYLIEKGKTAAQRRAEEAARERAEEEALKRRTLGLDGAGGAPVKKSTATKKKPIARKAKKKTPVICLTPEEFNKQQSATPTVETAPKVAPKKEATKAPATIAVPQAPVAPKAQVTPKAAIDQSVQKAPAAPVQTAPAKAAVKTAPPQAEPTTTMDEGALPKSSSKKKKKFINFD